MTLRRLPSVSADSRTGVQLGEMAFPRESAVDPLERRDLLGGRIVATGLQCCLGARSCRIRGNAVPALLEPRRPLIEIDDVERYDAAEPLDEPLGPYGHIGHGLHHSLGRNLRARVVERHVGERRSSLVECDAGWLARCASHLGGVVRRLLMHAGGGQPCSRGELENVEEGHGRFS
jgi:hypothetical protein